MRECCRFPSRYQCIRYVVSYPRLSRMTRRNGTTAYRRFCEREVVVAFRAGALAAVRRGAGLVDFAAFRLGADTGAARRTARAAGRAAGLAGAGDPFLPAGRAVVAGLTTGRAVGLGFSTGRGFSFSAA